MPRCRWCSKQRPRDSYDYVKLLQSHADPKRPRDSSVYSVMIQAYGSHGDGVEALDVLRLMLANGIAPDDICFVSALSACAHGGLVDDGLMVFDMMRAHGVEKRQVHYACVVDLLGRAGHLSWTLGVVQAMPFEPGKDVWGALLGACRLHNDMELAEHAAERLLILEAGNANTALAQMFDDSGRWDESSSVRRLMRDGGVNMPVASSIVVMQGRRWNRNGINTMLSRMFKTVVQLHGKGSTVKDPIVLFIYKRWENLQKHNSTDTTTPATT